MIQHPLVRDVVETSFNIAFQYPLGSIFLGEDVEASGDSVGTGTVGTESIGIGIRQRFGYWV